MEANPAKVKEWFDKAQYVKKISDSLYNYAEALKVSIVKQADGEDGDVKDVQNKEDLEAASHVMLAPREEKDRGCSRPSTVFVKASSAC